MSPLKKFLSVLLTLLFIWVTPANSNANTVFSLAGDSDLTSILDGLIVQ